MQLEFNWVSEDTAKAVSFAKPDNQGKYDGRQNPGLELSSQLVEEPCSWSNEHCSNGPLSSQQEAEQMSHGVYRAKHA